MTSRFMLIEMLLGLILLGLVYLICFVLWQVVKCTRDSRSSNKVGFHTAHKIVLPLLMALPTTLFVSYSLLWNQQFNLVDRSLQTTLPFLQLIAVAILAPIAPFIVVAASKLPRAKKTVFIIVALCAYGFFYSIPFWFESAVIIKGPLPPKPKLIAHRGISDLNPENTMSSFNAVFESPAMVVESDVGISTDGVLFHMHDEHFWRTTNVGAIFPKRATNLISTFSSEEIRRLDAGSSFSQKFKGEKIPFLNETLIMMKAHPGYRFIFDLRKPEKTHPYYDTVESITFDLIDHYNVSSQIIWIVDSIAYMRDRFPDMWLANPYDKIYPTDPDFFDIRNIPAITDNDNIRSSWRLKSSNKGYKPLAVIAYTVNTPWLFDQMWCLGVAYVTTNHVGLLSAMKAPTFYLQRTTYLILTLVWDIFFGLLTLALVVVTLQMVESESSAASDEKLEDISEPIIEVVSDEEVFRDNSPREL